MYFTSLNYHTLNMNAIQQNKNYTSQNAIQYYLILIIFEFTNPQTKAFNHEIINNLQDNIHTVKHNPHFLFVYFTFVIFLLKFCFKS